MKEAKKKSTVQWIMEFAGTHKNKYVLSVITATCGVVCGIAPYLIVAEIIKELVGGNKDWDSYIGYFITLVILWLARVIFHGISTSLSHHATFQVLGNIRKQTCDKLSRLPLGFVLDTPSGSLKNVIVERIDSIETTMAHVIPEFTSSLLGTLAMAIYLLTIDWRMGFASFITLVLGLVAYMGMMIDYQTDYQNTIDKTKKLNDTAVEYINGIEVIKAFGKAKSSYERFVVAAREGSECYVEWMRRCNVFFSIAMVLTPATMLAVLPIGGLLYMNGSLSANDLIMIIVIAVGLITPIVTCMSYSDDLGQIGTIMGEVIGIMEAEELIRPENIKEKPVDNTIILNNVKFGYKDKEILHGINLQFKEGTVNALVGPSGSGKSTIAKLVASLWDVGEGSIAVGGVDVRNMPLDFYNDKVAYVSQDNYLFDTTIMENIRMGKQGATDEEVIAAAKSSGCHEFIMSLEKGYDTVAGGAGGHLSGGERQRIAIARAMLKNAPIIILDEATAYTDPENEAIIQASVASLVKSKTLIVIAHRLSTIADSDNIVVVKDGFIDSQGTHEELLAMNGLYKEMWQAHMSVKDTMAGGAAYV
ncbi:MAG: ABC transporter ATP-binding protein [Lachnospiraceae bacterium]|nr:ABC transporter ATP-binding protein [Lachnospiraceae bacterium]